MMLCRHTPTRTRSIADIVRAMAALRDADDNRWDRAYALFGVRLAPLRLETASPAGSKPTKPVETFSPDDPTDTGPHRPGEVPHHQEPAAQEQELQEFPFADYDASADMPQRLGDQPAIDIPAEGGETGPAELVLPETEQRERLFETLPDAGEPRLVPLLDPRRSNNILREMCSVPQRSNTVDVMRLLSLASRARPMLSRLPYKTVRRPARRIAVAYDATDRMATFLDDAEAVKGQIKRTTNAQVIDLPCEIIEDLTDSERADSRPRLQHGMHVLLLSDLGYGGWARQREWRLPTPRRLRHLAEEIGQRGITMSALIPVPSATWEASLQARIAGLSWDRTSTLAAARQAMERSRQSDASQFGGKLRRPYQPAAGRSQDRIARRPLEGGPVEPLADADRVALTAIFCSRITPRRLRALRMAMLPRAAPEAEAQAWHSAHFIRYPSQIALVDHRSLDAIRNRAISWTRLVWSLKRFEPRAFLIWPDLASRPDETAGTGFVIRPRHWPRARRALAQALAVPELARRLAMVHPEWRPELDALLNGRGCVILEQARDHARAYVPTHVMEPFEDDLLWDAYLDSLLGSRQRVARKLARLEQSLTNILYKDEYRVGLDWTQHRLPHQPVVVQRNSQAQRLAMLAKEILGSDIGLPPADRDDVADTLEAGGGIELSESRQEQRDLYIWSPSTDVWRFQLEYGPGAQSPGAPLPIRIRVPALERTTLVLSGDGRSEELEVTREHGHQLSWAGPLTISTYQGASYPITGPRVSNSADAAFWLRHARSARLAGDWIAATRWARNAARDTSRLAAVFHLAKASAISEEHVDDALTRIDEVANLAQDERPSGLLWRSVLAAFSRMALLEVDSRLEEAVAAGRAALNLLAGNPSIAASAYRLRIGAAIVRFLQHRMQLRDALPVVRSMVRDLRHLGRHRRFRLVRQASAESLSVLVNAAIEAAKPRLAGKMVEEALTLPWPGDQEVEITACLTAACHASLYAPAARAVALYGQALDIARRSGRFDVFLEAATDYCRILYNSARIPKAANIVAEIVDRSMARRSARRGSLALSERAYQMRFKHGGIEMFDARAAVSTTPAEERRLLCRNLTTSQRWLMEEARKRGDSPEGLTRTAADAAGKGGQLFSELLFLDDMFHFVYIDRENGKRGLGPPPTPQESRFLYLANATGDNLGAANAFAAMARIEFPRWTGQWRMEERTDPNPLYERAIAICDKIEVIASVLIFRTRWAEELVAAGETDHALAVIEAAIRYGEGRKNVDLHFGMARATRGEILRVLGRVEEAKEELHETAEAALKAGAVQPLIEARTHLARIFADDGDWAAALEHLEFIDRTISSPMLPAYETPQTPNYGLLIADLVDGRALQRLEETIARQQELENPETPEDKAAPGARARHFRLRGRREREKANRRAVWQTFTSRAGVLLRRSMTQGGSSLPAADIPFNDFWYWGQALVNAGSSQAIWFLERALERPDTDEKVSPRSRGVVEGLLATARSFVTEGGG